MTKLAKDMTPAERAAALEEIKRGPDPEPMPVDKKAAEMSEAERREWLAEHKRRFG